MCDLPQYPCLNIMESQYLANWTSFHILIFVCICGEQSLKVRPPKSKQPNLDYSWIMDPSCLSPKGWGGQHQPHSMWPEKIREGRWAASKLEPQKYLPPPRLELLC